MPGEVEPAAGALAAGPDRRPLSGPSRGCRRCGRPACEGRRTHQRAHHGFDEFPPRGTALAERLITSLAHGSPYLTEILSWRRQRLVQSYDLPGSCNTSAAPSDAAIGVTSACATIPPIFDEQSNE